MKVKLYVGATGFVVSGTIPPFDIPPRVLIWGDRVFCHVPKQKGIASFERYEEAFCVALVQTDSQEEAA